MMWSADDGGGGERGGDLELLGPFAQLGSRLGPLTVLQRRLDGCESLAELLAVASSIGPGVCGFERGVVLSVIGGYLSANGMDALDHPASDALRHRCQVEPIALSAQSEEAEVIRLAQGGRRERSRARSVLARALGLEQHVLAAVVPESQALALVVFDRSDPAVSEEDRAVVRFFAHLLGLAVIRVALRMRIRELSHEIRHLTASANALVQEAQLAPIGLTIDMGQGPVFTAAGRRTAPASALVELLSERERAVAALMAMGRSNREIAEELHLALGTVKAHVVRVLRKLKASNRAEAVARYIELQDKSD
jgi:DNA-binding CsgD family transcriptional regulator